MPWNIRTGFENCHRRCKSNDRNTWLRCFVVVFLSRRFPKNQLRRYPVVVVHFHLRRERFRQIFLLFAVMVQNIFRASIATKRKDSPMYVGILAWVLRVLNGLIHDLYVPHTFWRQISLNEWSCVTLWRIYGTIGVQWYFCCVTLRLYNDTISSTDEAVAIWISTWFRSELRKEWLFHR